MTLAQLRARKARADETSRLYRLLAVAVGYAVGASIALVLCMAALLK